jgi:hypothetical protein
VERGIEALLEVQREARVEESLMEVCVKRPAVVGKAMERAIVGIEGTVMHGQKKDAGVWKSY